MKNYDDSVYSLKHFPGLVRPARPALYLAEAFDIGETSNDSTLNLGLNTFCFAKPGSITYVIPSIVNDVSAIFVAITILRPGIPFLFGGGGPSNIRYYYTGGRVEYRGTHFTKPTSEPSFSISFVIFLHASSISYL